MEKTAKKLTMCELYYRWGKCNEYINGYFCSELWDRKSYTTNNQNGTIRLIDQNKIRLPKLKEFKIKIHRQLPQDGLIKSATISSIRMEFDREILPVIPKKETILGLDYSSKTLVETILNIIVKPKPN